MWITSLCLLLSVGYRGQHDLNTQVANTQLFGWVFGTWVFTTLGIVEVGYSVLLPLYAGTRECWGCLKEEKGKSYTFILGSAGIRRVYLLLIGILT